MPSLVFLYSIFKKYDMYTRVAVEYFSKVPLLYMYTTKQADKYLHKFQSINIYLYNL